jgi:hypothetical protein
MVPVVSLTARMVPVMSLTARMVPVVSLTARMVAGQVQRSLVQMSAAALRPARAGLFFIFYFL